MSITQDILQEITQQLTAEIDAEILKKIYANMTPEQRDLLRERIKNMLRVSDYMLGRVVDYFIDNPIGPLYYDIASECQCRNLDGILTDPTDNRRTCWICKEKFDGEPAYFTMSMAGPFVYCSKCWKG